MPTQHATQTPLTLAARTDHGYPSLDRQQETALHGHVERTLTIARKTGVEIQYMGIAPLFAEPILYPAENTDWIIKPAEAGEPIVVPRREQQALRRLHDAGIDFPAIYIAHEIEKTVPPTTTPGGGTPFETIHRDDALRLVGPPPEPISTLELAGKLDNNAGQLLGALAKAAPIAAAILAAPFLAAGAAVGALATLDPIILGVIPATSATPAALGGWFVLARWDW